MDCADDYAMGEIIIVKIKEKTKLLMLCDGEKFVLFSHSGGNKEFAYSGKTQSYTVPFPVTEITIHAFGAGGGTGLAHNQAQRSRGGAGGYATATVAVKPGDKFSVIVGEGGRNGKIPPKANSFGGGTVTLLCVLCGVLKKAFQKSTTLKSDRVLLGCCYRRIGCCYYQPRSTARAVPTFLRLHFAL